jgi:hypothetical protein
MKATIEGRKVNFKKSDSDLLPIKVVVEGMNIGNYPTFFDAEKAALELCKKYPKNGTGEDQ